MGYRWNRRNRVFNFRRDLYSPSFNLQSYTGSTSTVPFSPWQRPYRESYSPPTIQQPYLPQPTTTPSLGATHMNCSHYSNGVCTLTGIAVPAQGAACPRFTPRH